MKGYYQMYITLSMENPEIAAKFYQLIIEDRCRYNKDYSKTFFKGIKEKEIKKDSFNPFKAKCHTVYEMVPVYCEYNDGQCIDVVTGYIYPRNYSGFTAYARFEANPKEVAEFLKSLTLDDIERYRDCILKLDELIKQNEYAKDKNDRLKAEAAIAERIEAQQIEDYITRFRNENGNLKK